MSPEYFSRDADGKVQCDMDAAAVEFTLALMAELRDLLDNPDLAGPEVAWRLVPAAHPDDLEAEASYRALVADQLDRERHSALDTVVSMLRENAAADGRVLVSLDSDDMASWMQSLNHLRLALGTLLNVTEDEDLSISEEDPGYASAIAYDFLAHLLMNLVDASDSFS